MNMHPHSALVRRLSSKWRPNAFYLVASALLIAKLPAPILGADAATADYASGVERFLKLGLPDVKNATYVKIDWRSGYYGDRFGRNDALKLTGNAWVLSEGSNKTAKVLVEGVQEMEVVDPKVLEEQQKKLMEEFQAKMKAGQRNISFPDYEDKPSGVWKAADLQKDIESILALLKKGEPDMQEALNDEIGGDLFLFALHAYRKGQTAQANELIAQIFKVSGDNRKILSLAMNRLADAQYAKVYQDFDRSGNWQAYLTNMETLTTRFTTVWRSRPVVERVIAALRKHLAMKTPPPLSDPALKEEDQKLALELANADKPVAAGSLQDYGTLWVLGSGRDADPELAILGGESSEEKTAIARILQRRQQSIPMLVAMLKDEYLIRTKGSEQHSFVSSSADTPSESEIEMLYQSFQRPLTRGEIARALLDPLVIEDEERYDSERRPDNAEIEKRARAWYEKHKDKTKGQLLRFYLTEGSKSNQRTALYQLFNSKEEEDRKAVEAFLLKAENLTDYVDMVASYATKQGDVAKPFVKQYIAKIKALPSLIPADELKYTKGEQRKRREDQAKAQLEALEELVSDKTAAEMLKEITASDKKWDRQELAKVQPALFAKLSKQTNDQAFILVLEAITKAKNDILAEMLLRNLRSLLYELDRPGDLPALNPPKLDISKHAKYWKEILSQKRGPIVSPYGITEDVSFNELVVTQIEYLYSSDPEESALRTDAARVVGRKILEVIQKRAEARLAGKAEAELPAYPDADKVTAERKTALRKELAALTPETQAQFVNKLPLDEIVALPELLESDQTLNAKLVPGSHIIRSVKIGITNDAIKKLFEPLQGKPLERKTTEQLLEEVKKQLQQGVPLVFRFSRTTPLGGLELDVRQVPPESPYAQYGSRKMPAFIMAQVGCSSSDSFSASARWQVEGAKKPAAPTAADQKEDEEDILPIERDIFGESNKEQQEKFWETFGKLLDPKLNAAAQYQCYFMGIIPSTKE